MDRFIPSRDAGGGGGGTFASPTSLASRVVLLSAPSATIALAAAATAGTGNVAARAGMVAGTGTALDVWISAAADATALRRPSPTHVHTGAGGGDGAGADGAASMVAWVRGGGVPALARLHGRLLAHEMLGGDDGAGGGGGARDVDDGGGGGGAGDAGDGDGDDTANTSMTSTSLRVDDSVDTDGGGGGGALDAATFGAGLLAPRRVAGGSMSAMAARIGGAPEVAVPNGGVHANLVAAAAAAATAAAVHTSWRSPLRRGDADATSSTTSGGGGGGGATLLLSRDDDNTDMRAALAADLWGPTYAAGNENVRSSAPGTPSATRRRRGASDTAPPAPASPRVLHFRRPFGVQLPVDVAADDDDVDGAVDEDASLAPPPRRRHMDAGIAAGGSGGTPARRRPAVVVPDSGGAFSSALSPPPTPGSLSRRAPVNAGGGVEAADDAAALAAAGLGRTPGLLPLPSPMRSPLAARSRGQPPPPAPAVVASPPPAAAPSPGRAAARAIRAHALAGLSPTASGVLAAPMVQRRRIGRVPHKVLDAPGLPDDFYLNLLDWSATNVLAVGLVSDVYLWNGFTAAVEKLANYTDGVTATSVGWSVTGSHLAVGLSSGDVQVWDVAAKRLVRTMGGHTQRATAVAWAGPTLASCGRDNAVYIRDVRAPADYHAQLRGHTNEVCGLKWSPDRSMLATGANDNVVMVWSSAYMRTAASATTLTAATTPLWRFTEHKAAVKALAWSPHTSGLLASGGGSYDRSIRFHSVSTGDEVGMVDVGAQVTQLVWAPHANELASTQGFSQNSLSVWRYPTLVNAATLVGHQSRVLYMAMAPEGESVVTGAPDDTLRFWNVFPPARRDTGDDADPAPPPTPLLPVVGNSGSGSSSSGGIDCDGTTLSPAVRRRGGSGAGTTSLAAFACIR